MAERKITSKYIARVEGEGGINLTLSGNEVEDLELNIFEPPRFFQSWLVGRKYDEVPDLTARICGICPVTHILAAIEAMEQALGFTPSENTKKWRELLQLSQWVQSHALHTYMLAAPDLLGYKSVIEMAPDYKEVVEQALKIKRLGNDLTVAIGGREVHPVTAVVGGFTALPDQNTIDNLVERFKDIRKDVEDMVKVISTLSVPDFTHDTEYVALRDENNFAIIGDRLVSTKGLDISKDVYREYITEKHIPHSNTLHSVMKDRDSFAVGPLARLNINYDKLHPKAKELGEKYGFNVYPSNNPFMSIPARALETVHAVERCLELFESVKPGAERAEIDIKAGEGSGIVEAPRGTDYHYYRIDNQGFVEKADIVAPTSHNMYNIENEMKQMVPGIADLSDDELALRCEMLVRAYDPCISCATHAIKAKIERK